MQVTPKTEEQIIRESLWPEGIYDFEIVDAKDKVSPKENEMIELKVALFDDEGGTRYIFDYLVDALPFKLRHCAVACGLLDRYEQGFLESFDFIGKRGKLRLIIKKDKNKQYPDKNSIQDYVTEPVDSSPVAKHEEAKRNGFAPVKPNLDDEIPF